MKTASYYARVLSGMRLRRFLPILDRAHELSGRSRLWLTADMIRCAVRYGSGYHDYIQFGMYDLSQAQKSTMVTRVVNRKLMDALNDEKDAHVLNDKGEFARVYKKFLKRDVLSLADAAPADIDTFLARHPRMFCKPRDGSCGHGCFVYDKGNYPPPPRNFCRTWPLWAWAYARKSCPSTRPRRRLTRPA